MGEKRIAMVTGSGSGIGKSIAPQMAAVRFFAAPESGFITGQVLHVCGGKSVKSDW